MPKLLPNQSFYPSATMAMQAPSETLAYGALLNPDPTASDALAVVSLSEYKISVGGAPPTSDGAANVGDSLAKTSSSPS